MLNQLKNELQNILSGKSQVRFGGVIQATACYLNNGEEASRTLEKEKHLKKQEAESLEHYISDKNLWVENIDFSQYVSEGAEQKVFLRGTESVLKLNDAIYYRYWKDYFYNLLLHNFFFSDTAYELVGFTKDNDILYAVVQQNYVAVTSITDLSKVKKFLTQNGFENNRNNDYVNSELGIILEDLHDENVLTRNEILYFIDTVFYLTDNFWIRD
ncbi:MAG: hypothetical protein ACOH1O_07190 [Flavobacterium sp.]